VKLDILPLFFTNYLIDVVDIRPLSFWRDNEHRFPAIAALARDVLSVPATGAGVERLFNTARDVCHYRRGRMKSKTIQELMMFLCTSRFDLKEQDAKRLEEFFTRDEIEAAREEKDEKYDEIMIEPISDTEEPDELEKDVVIGDVEDEASDPQLPDNSTQLRASGRKRRQREDDTFEYH
jgi:hypothetical protein